MKKINRKLTKFNYNLLPICNFYLVIITLLLLVIIKPSPYLLTSIALGAVLPLWTNVVINYALLLCQSDKIRLVISNAYRIIVVTAVFLVFYFVFDKSNILQLATAFIITYTITISFIIAYYKLKGDDNH